MRNFSLVLAVFAVLLGATMAQELEVDEYDTPEQCEDIGVIEGNDCDPQVDCKQCGFCDFFLHCSNSTRKWTRQQCDQIVQTDGTILTTDKLFWNRDSTEHGGICDLYTSLESPLADKYRKHPRCKTVCELKGPIEGCLRTYTYTEPDFKSGIWHSEPVEFKCPVNMQWNQTILSCTFCAKGNDCSGC